MPAVLHLAHAATRKPGAAACMLFLAMACSGNDASGQAGFTVRDSLGISIHESATLGPRVTATEELRLGAVNGPPATTFFQVADARLGSDGTLFVLDGGDNLVKVFDRSGTPLVAMGGTGEGPAEFAAAWNLEVRGDTILVLDRNLRRIVTFGSRGALLDTRRIGFSVSEHGFPVALVSRPNGRLLIEGASGCALPRGPGDNRWGIYAFGADGAVDDTLMRASIGNALPVYTSGPRISCTVVAWPFRPGPTIAFDPAGGAVTSPADVFEIRRLDASLARVIAVTRWAVPLRRVTAADRRGFLDHLGARELSLDLRRAAERAVDSIGYPDVWPAIAALKVAGRGSVWALRARPIGAEQQEWDMLTDGRHVRTVVLPGGLRVLDVRGERVVGVLMDALDVEYVAVFRAGG